MKSSSDFIACLLYALFHAWLLFSHASMVVPLSKSHHLCMCMLVPLCLSLFACNIKLLNYRKLYIFINNYHIFIYKIKERKKIIFY